MTDLAELIPDPKQRWTYLMQAVGAHLRGLGTQADRTRHALEQLPDQEADE